MELRDLPSVDELLRDLDEPHALAVESARAVLESSSTSSAEIIRAA